MMSRRLLTLIGSVAMALLAADCGRVNRDTEIYNDGQTVVQIQDSTQHKGGYGRSDCLLCHNAALNLHRNAAVPIDVDALNAAIQNNGQSAYCLTCHGRNGT